LQEVLSVRGVSKAYPGVTALEDVSFSLRRGEIRALCGENGAGKSTLVKIFMGLVAPDRGSIAVNGQTQIMRSPQQAQGVGLGLVAQELSLAPHLSILDNIWLGSPEVPFLHRRAKLRLRAEHALATLGLADWDLDRPVGSLTIGQRQLIEIAPRRYPMPISIAFSASSGVCARKAAPSSTSHIGSARCLSSAIQSPCFGTERMSRPARSARSRGRSWSN